MKTHTLFCFEENTPKVMPVKYVFLLAKLKRAEKDYKHTSKKLLFKIQNLTFNIFKWY
jgi:hypothetical protein